MKEVGLVLIAVLMVVSLADGANWVKVEEDGKTVHYIDEGSVTRKENIVKFWHKVDYPYTDHEVKSYVAYIELDCSERKYRILQLTTYLLNGKTSSDTVSRNWSYIIPGTKEEYFADLCNK